MSRRTLTVDDDLYRYLVDHSLREHPAQAALRAATAAHPHAGMQISPEQGQFMALLVKLIGARRAVEIGVFTGYSALTRRARAARRRPAARLRHQRRVHARRPALLGAGRRRAQDRPAARAGARDPRRAARRRRGGAVRLRLHRCRQDELRRLLRALPAAAASGRPDRDRQHLVERQGGAPGRRRRRHRRAAGAQRQAAWRRAHRPVAPAHRRRTDARAQALTRCDERWLRARARIACPIAASQAASGARTSGIDNSHRIGHVFLPDRRPVADPLRALVRAPGRRARGARDPPRPRRAPAPAIPAASASPTPMPATSCCSCRSSTSRRTRRTARPARST